MKQWGCLSWGADVVAYGHGWFLRYVRGQIDRQTRRWCYFAAGVRAGGAFVRIRAEVRPPFLKRADIAGKDCPLCRTGAGYRRSVVENVLLFSTIAQHLL